MPVFYCNFFYSVKTESAKIISNNIISWALTMYPNVHKFKVNDSDHIHA